MKKCLFPAIILLLVLTVTLCTQAQPAASQDPGSAAGGGMGGGQGMMAAATQRPDKTDRLASIAELEKQIAALKTAIQKAPSTDPCIPQLQGDALTTFTAQYNEENTAINAIVRILNTIRPAAGAAGGRGGRGGLTTDVIAELTKIAQEEKAAKLTLRLEALAKEAAAAPARGGMGGGMGGGRGSSVPSIPGGFQWID